MGICTLEWVCRSFRLVIPIGKSNINTSTHNNINIISSLDNISNQVPSDNAYPDANLRCNLFSFVADIGSTSYVIDTGDICIILNN